MDLYQWRRLIWVTGVLFVLVIVTACNGGSKPTTLDEVTVQLSWHHYGAFGGFYAADQNGLYRDANITVSFLEGGPAYDPIDAVVAGEAEFGVASADTLLLARAEGKPVRAVATVLRRSPVVLVSLADAGIIHPEQLVGKKVRMTSQIAPSFRL